MCSCWPYESIVLSEFVKFFTNGTVIHMERRQFGFRFQIFGHLEDTKVQVWRPNDSSQSLQFWDSISSGLCSQTCYFTQIRSHAISIFVVPFYPNWELFWHHLSANFWPNSKPSCHQFRRNFVFILCQIHPQFRILFAITLEGISC